jgi:hypothetical protein
MLGGGGGGRRIFGCVSGPLRSLSAPWNFPIVLAAHSSNESAPLPFVELGERLATRTSTSSASILPSLFVGAAEPFLLAVLALASAPAAAH